VGDGPLVYREKVRRYRTANRFRLFLDLRHDPVVDVNRQIDSGGGHRILSKRHHSDYDEVTTTRCERALVTLLGTLGHGSAVYLVGGLAPRYVVGSLPRAHGHTSGPPTSTSSSASLWKMTARGVPHTGEQPQEGGLQGCAIVPVEEDRRGSHRDRRVSVRTDKVILVASTSRRKEPDRGSEH